MVSTSNLHMESLEEKFAQALKSVARRKDLKAYVEQTPVFYNLLQRAAARYVVGENREAGLQIGRQLIEKGYTVSVEYIGENVTDAEACLEAVQEIKQLISQSIEQGIAARVSFDLTHIGLSVNAEFALEQLVSLAEQAKPANIELFIGMEESSKTDAIIEVYERAVAAGYDNIGITMQAHLNRSIQLLNHLQAYPARIRFVKGAYQEPEHLVIPRSDALNKRYLQLIELAIDKGHDVSIATHDEQIVDEVIQRGWANLQKIEFELLYGIRPELSSRLKRAGYTTRVYLPYGHEWFLYVCHRISEYPPNFYQAFIDIVNEQAADSVASYE